MRMTRRDLLKNSLLFGAMAGMETKVSFAEESRRVYKVGTWMDGLGAFDFCARAGLDAVQFTFPFKEGGDADIRNPDVCKKLLDRSAETGIEISSVALGDFNGNPFWEINDAEQRVLACLEAMTRLNVSSVLVPFFGKATLNADDRFDETIRRFKSLAPKALDAGKVLAIESTLGSDGHFRILNEVDSPAVEVFYDPGNMIHRFKDTDEIVADIYRLRGHLVACHAKDGGLLGKGKIDYAKILAAYREIGFFGAQILEGSVDGALGQEESYRQNAEYLRSI